MLVTFDSSNKVVRRELVESLSATRITRSEMQMFAYMVSLDFLTRHLFRGGKDLVLSEDFSPHNHGFVKGANIVYDACDEASDVTQISKQVWRFSVAVYRRVGLHRCRVIDAARGEGRKAALVPRSNVDNRKRKGDFVDVLLDLFFLWLGAPSVSS